LAGQPVSTCNSEVPQAPGAIASEEPFTGGAGARRAVTTKTFWWAKWPYWRATPGLVAHVARVCDKVARSLPHKEPRLSIVVAMRGDREVFKSPEEFSKDITREALQNFETLTIKARGPSLKIAVTFSRDPHLFRAREKDDRGVLLQVHAQAPISRQQINLAGERLSRAVDRGRPWKAPSARKGWSHNSLPGTDERKYWATRVTSTRLATAIASLFALVPIYSFGDVSDDRAWVYLVIFVFSFAAISLVVGLGGLYLQNWLFPAVEIAPQGNSNMWRTVKWLFLLGVGALVTILLS
jgi:hypothetical protein